MAIQDKNMKNNIKSKNYLKRKTLRELEKLEIDWLVYSYKAIVLCIVWKSISGKMSVDSVQN